MSIYQSGERKEEGGKTKVFGIRWALLKNFEDLTAEKNVLKIYRFSRYIGII